VVDLFQLGFYKHFAPDAARGAKRLSAQSGGIANLSLSFRLCLPMKIFISWSGDRSRLIAEALRDWLRLVIPRSEPWLSKDDIRKGTRWSTELATILEQAQFGIICLTPDNIDRPWILFEAGALSKALTNAYVCPLLFISACPDCLGTGWAISGNDSCARRCEHERLPSVKKSANENPNH
jgi:TIR domain